MSDPLPRITAMELAAPRGSEELMEVMDRSTAAMAAASGRCFRAVASYDDQKLWKRDGATSMSSWRGRAVRGTLFQGPFPPGRRICRFPGCERKRWIQAHHLVHWADGGGTTLDNLVLLCHAHHRLIHKGGWRISGHPGRDLRFHDPTGRRLGRVAPRSRDDYPRLAARGPLAHSAVDVPEPSLELDDGTHGIGFLRYRAYDDDPTGAGVDHLGQVLLIDAADGEPRTLLA